MKACDVVTGLRAEVEQWRARAIRAEGPGYSRMADERRALLEAAAALVGRNPAACEVGDVVEDLHALRAQGFLRVVVPGGGARGPSDGDPSEQVMALRDAIADVTGHDPWIYTVEESIVQLREWAKRRGTGHEQIECQRAEIERLRSDLARVGAERDEARAVERTYQTVLSAHERAARDLTIALYGEVRGVLDIPATMRAAAQSIPNLRVGMQRLQQARDEARAAARLTTIPAGGRVVSADIWERLSALADAVREVGDAD